MTSSALLAPPAPPPTRSWPRPGHRLLGVAAIAGTLPYLVLKSVWLTGGRAGVTDPALLASASMTVLNAVTVAMDACVVALALVLTTRRGLRAPALPVLLPAWVGTGFLVPMAVSVLPATLLSLDGPPEATVLAPWVQPLVYGGFAWQGVFLVAAFAGYARERWGTLVAHPVRRAAAVEPVLRVVAGGAAVTALVSAALHVATGPLIGGGVAIMTEGVNAALAVAGAWGLVSLVRRRGPRRLALAAAWTGCAAMFSWGLWSTVTTMGATALATGGVPTAGLAAVTGLLAGLSGAIGALLAL
ncbi:hypothetical protein [Pseudonocardia sp. N23]|uniref:hypothetical protein n=1 Tax=Pseudonocardia sp. N23 TaxID=1987376 RepID=UPI000BFE834F|nr:hypothetical protein [Pseudonocardia sp. N23]GAY10590.1 hypothetical protein TOK_4951 [Pseudonocardia sp. N23]